MAFYNKIGSLMRQTISQNSAASSQFKTATMFNAVRCMSSKLFIGGLSYNVDDQNLREAFSGFGEVVEARVIVDRDTGRSRGFGFVGFSDSESANSAMSAMDGQEMSGRNIRVSLAQERERTPRSSYGNYEDGRS